MKSETPLLDGIRRMKEQHRKTHGYGPSVILLSPEVLDELAMEISFEASSAWRHPWEDQDSFFERMRQELKTNQVYYVGVHLRFDQ